MIHTTNTTIRLYAVFLLVVLVIGGCAGGPSPSTKEAPLSPPKHANPLAVQLIIEGNRLFADGKKAGSA